MTTTQPPAPAESVTSADGTTGYRHIGDGPGVVLLHGAMEASQNFTRLAGARPVCRMGLLDRQARKIMTSLKVVLSTCRP